MSEKHLVLKYRLDYPERSDRPTGKVMLIVEDINNNNHVHAVQVTDCTLQAIREDMQALYELGDIFVPANDTDLFDYEFVHGTLECQLTEVNAKLAAEDAHYELERNRKTAAKVLNMLSSQSFDDFYKGVHEDYITGEANALSEEEMQDLVIQKFIKKF